jgi:hypothetical protein
LSDITQITGSLNSSLAVNLISLTAPSLETIGASLNVIASVKITTLQFNSLTSIGSLVFNAVPFLHYMELGGGGVTTIGNVSIINTGFVSIDWLKMDTVKDFVLQNNQDLITLDLDALRSFTGDLDISGNNADLVVTMPNVTTANSISIANLTSVGMSSIQKLAGDLDLSGDSMSEINLPELVNTSSIRISSDMNLETLDMSKLILVAGDLSIISNDKLAAITMPALEVVNGDMTLTGAISKLVRSYVLLFIPWPASNEGIAFRYRQSST